MISGLLSRALADEATTAKLEDWLVTETLTGPRGDVHELAELLHDHLAAVPAAVEALTAMTKQPPLGRSVAFVAGQVLLYLVDEDDLFSDREFGVLGMLDDAYLLHGSIATLTATFPQLTVPAAYAPPDRRARDAVRALLPAGVAEALDQTCQNLVRVAATLYAGGDRSGQAPEPVPPTLRVNDALERLRPSPAREPA